jgi:hypothetical protein
MLLNLCWWHGGIFLSLHLQPSCALQITLRLGCVEVTVPDGPATVPDQAVLTALCVHTAGCAYHAVCDQIISCAGSSCESCSCLSRSSAAPSQCIPNKPRPCFIQIQLQCPVWKQMCTESRSVQMKQRLDKLKPLMAGANDQSTSANNSSWLVGCCTGCYPEKGSARLVPGRQPRQAGGKETVEVNGSLRAGRACQPASLTLLTGPVVLLMVCCGQ